MWGTGGGFWLGKIWGSYPEIASCVVSSWTAHGQRGATRCRLDACLEVVRSVAASFLGDGVGAAWDADGEVSFLPGGRCNEIRELKLPEPHRRGPSIEANFIDFECFEEFLVLGDALQSGLFKTRQCCMTRHDAEFAPSRNVK